jgi:hypothetical protein
VNACCLQVRPCLKHVVLLPAGQISGKAITGQGFCPVFARLCFLVS